MREEGRRPARATEPSEQAVRKAHENNPLHRVKVFDEGVEELHLVTTTGYLAERIGKAFRDRWHADDAHPQGSIRVRLLKSAVQRNAASRNQQEGQVGDGCRCAWFELYTASSDVGGRNPVAWSARAKGRSS